MNLRFGALKVNHNNIDVSVSGYYDIFYMGEEDTIAFWENYLTSSRMLGYYDAISTGTLVEKKRVHYSQFVDIEKPVPTVPEQKKIASFFSCLDEKIANQRELVKAIAEKKKTIVKKLLSGEIKFTDNGKSFSSWNTYPLGKLLVERKEYSEKDGTFEHISLTKEGVIPKSERYERDFLVTTDNKKYKITKLNDICYNPANLKFGVICRNTYGTGIFSPIYITFETTELVLPEFIEMVVTQTDFINYALKYQEGTVYEKMAVSPEDLLTIKVPIPSIEEQKKITAFINALNEKLQIETQLISDYETLKKGFVQQMFA